MAAIRVLKEVTIGEVPKDNKSKIVVSRISANIGEYVAVIDHYIPKGESEYVPGKGKWIPLECASEVADLIQIAYVQEQ